MKFYCLVTKLVVEVVGEAVVAWLFAGITTSIRSIVFSAL
jgi:hypothetical protein